MSLNFNAQEIALAVISDKTATQDSIAPVVIDTLFKQVYGTSTYRLKHDIQPSKEHQLSLIKEISGKVTWIVENSTYPDVLDAYKNHRSLIIRRAVAGNPVTPQSALEYLLEWSLKKPDQECLNNVARNIDLSKILTSLSDLTTLKAYEIAGLSTEKLAQRLDVESTPAIAQIAIEVADQYVLSRLAVAAHHGLTGSVTLQDISIAVKRVGKAAPDLLDATLSHLILTEPVISKELFEVTSSRIKKISYGYESTSVGDIYKHPAPTYMAPEAIEAILRQSKSKSRHPAGYNKHSSSSFAVSLINGWSPTETLARRLAKMSPLTPELITAVLDVAHLPAAANLVKNRGVTLSPAQIDRILEICKNHQPSPSFEFNQHRELAKKSIRALRKRYDLTDAQAVTAFLIDDQDLSELVHISIPGHNRSRNALTVGFIKQLALLADHFPSYSAGEGEVTARHDVLVGLADDLAREQGRNYRVSSKGKLIFHHHNGYSIKSEKTSSFTFSKEIADELVNILPLTGVIKAINTAYTEGQTELDHLEVVKRLKAELGDYGERWDIFLELSSSWNGGFRELLDSVATLVPTR